MLRHCQRCGRVGFWFRFYSIFLGTHTWAPDLCKRCVSDLTYVAVGQYFAASAPPESHG